MILEDTILKVKQSVDTYEVVSSFITLKKKGADYVASCPFHNEKSPSFSISKSKNIYKCFGCGKSGDGITWLVEHEKMTFIEAIKWIAEKNNIEIEETSTKKTTSKPIPRLEKLSKETIDYFENNRKISNNTLLSFKITECQEWMPKAKNVVKTLCFNYFEYEKLINIKYRAKNKDFKLVKDAKLIFYNLDAIRGQKSCFITEGEIDTLSLYEVGILNAVSVPNGASVNGVVKLEYLDNCFEYFKEMEKVVLLVDNDLAGSRLREELARRIGYNKCYVVNYLDGCKDANDVLVKYGKEALLSVIKQARLYPLDGEMTMDDMFETVIDFYENGYPKGDNCGMSKKFDEHITFYRGQLTMVTGIPGSGKSEVVDKIMAGLTKLHGWDWGICSFECDPPFHVTKLAEKIVGKSFDFRKDENNRINREELEKAIALVDKHFHFMNISKIEITIDGLIAKAIEFVERYGIKGFLFDPWNCIELEGEDNTSLILQRLNKIIAFLDKYKVHGIIVAHPTKLRKDLATKMYEIPTLYSISGSAHFFNRTHNGFSVYRDFDKGRVDVIFQKIKFSWLGKLGVASFDFNTLTRQYVPLNDPLQDGEDDYKLNNTPNDLSF